MKASSTHAGYLRISFTVGGIRKTWAVHRVIATTFLPSPEGKATVNHINHDKADNRIVNLEWATVTEQNRHKRKPAHQEHYVNSTRSVWKCDKSGVRLQLYPSLKLAALSVTACKDGKTKVCAVARGSRITAYGYKWEYDSEEVVETEEWKDIPPELVKGVNGYAISSEGRIRNHKGRIGMPYLGTGGYRWVSVHPMQYLAHILIARVFLVNPFNKPYVNHKDGNKGNPRASNLEWVTGAENSQHAHDTGLNKTGKRVQQLQPDGTIVAEYVNVVSAGKETGVVPMKIYRAVKNNKLTAGFRWLYVAE
jgi:hypothetical protein